MNNIKTQQKVLLGAADGSASEISAFALQNAQWMQAKVAYNTDYSSNYNLIASLAYLSDQTVDGKSSVDVINSPTCPSTKFTWTAGSKCSETVNTRTDCSAPVVSTPISCASLYPGSTSSISTSGCKSNP